MRAGQRGEPGGDVADGAMFKDAEEEDEEEGEDDAGAGVHEAATHG